MTPIPSHNVLERPTSAAITLTGVGKTYALYASPGERLRASLFGKASAAPRIHHALSDITLAIQRGETVGVLGVNGAGKSTLLQIVTGVLTPSAGAVAVNGRIAALLELGAGFNPALTGRQNAEFQCRLNDTPAGAMAARMAEIEAFADIGYYFDQPMRTYSSGMYIRVAFAAAISVDPDILIIDEALAVGDGRFQNKCYRRFDEFKAAGKTILLVTHSPDLVTRHCTRGIVLDQGRLALDGGAADAAARYLEILYGRKPIADKPPQIEKAVETPPDAPRLRPETLLPDWLRQSHAQDMLPGRAGYNSAEYRTGTGGVSIVDAAILVHDQPATPWIHAGARLSIAMQVKSAIAVESPVYTIRLKTVDDVLVWSFSTHWVRESERFERPQPLVDGSSAVAVFDFDIDLAGGEYFIDLAVGASEGEEIETFDWRMSVLHIYVLGREGFYGLVDLKGGYKVALLSPAVSAGE